MDVTVFSGPQDLEVVGEYYREDNIRLILRGHSGDVLRECVGVLWAEPDNPFDSNAISVWVDGLKVGYLTREDAQVFRGPVEKLSSERPIAMKGWIVGRLEPKWFQVDVILEYDPMDFGLEPVEEAVHDGLYKLMRRDTRDTTYDLEWLGDLPEDTRRAITRLEELLGSATSPIDRHFMFNQLEWRLYRLRDVEPDALERYDEACRRHDAEMPTIRAALTEKLGAMPKLETYKQMCIRRSKAKDFEGQLWWAERGLEVYGDKVFVEDWLDDLRKRAAGARAKLGR